MSSHRPKAPKIRYPSSRTTKKQVSLATFRRKDSDGKFVPVRLRRTFATSGLAPARVADHRTVDNWKARMPMRPSSVFTVE